MARDITLIEPDPEDWGGWVIYLLERMEGEAQRRGVSNTFNKMMDDLSQQIGN